MSRLCDGVDDCFEWAIGSGGVTGANTFAQIIKLDAGVSWQAYLGIEHTTDGSEYAVGRHSGGNIASYAGGGSNTQTAVSHSSSDGWMLVLTKRAAGVGQIARHLKYPIGGSPTWGNVGGGMDNPRATVRIVFGEIDGSDFFKGRVQALAIFPTALSDADAESLATTMTLANWLAKGAVWLTDERDAFQTDHTGNGGSRTSIVGTADDADDPAGWASWDGGGGGGPVVKNLGTLGVG